MTLKDQVVLVTGADGFIGSHLAERLVREGARVRALVQYNSFGRWGWLDRADPDLLAGMDVIAGDIRDSERMASAVDGCAAVFHLAALIAIPYSYEAPQSYVDTNITGTLNVLTAARRHGGAKVIHTSTSEVYGTPLEVPIRETHPLQGQSPYSASKIAADKLAESFHHAFGLPVVVLRPFNTYGPRQSDRAVLPTILSQLLSGRETLRLGSLWPRRDLTYVDDTVEGFVCAAVTDAAVGDTIQLGTGLDWSIEDLAAMAMAVVGRTVPIVTEDQRQRPPASEVARLLSDPARARAVLGWEPRVVLEEGIRRTAAWVADNLHAYRADRYAI
jgi:NAD dependent epimerase/dehydratase